jgi:DNA-binding NarL/FixJ family response regulator
MDVNAAGGATRPLKILIIDDSPEDRRAFRRMIEECPKHTHEISEAETAYDGLVIAQIDDWDVIFLDYNLPDISGLDFLAEYRKHTPKVVLPVVMLTGHGRESVAVDAMKHGAFDYVSKAEASPDRLNGIIHHAISVSQMHRKEEETARDRMRQEEELKLRQIKAAELYAIGVTSSTYNGVVGEQLERIDDALGALLESQITPEQRRELKAALEASRTVRDALQELGKLDLFGLLRYHGSRESAAPASVGENGI